MFSKSLAVGVLAAGCVAAAAGGAYVAVRQNTSGGPPPAIAAVQPTQAPDAPKLVAETEAVVTPSPAAEATRPTVVPEAVSTARPQPSSVTAREKPSRSPARASQTPSSRPAPSARTESSTAPARPVVDPPRGEVTAAAPAREARDPAAEPSATAPAGRVAAEAVARPEIPTPPSSPQFEQLLVPASSVIGLQVETPLTTERARVEDRVDARVTRDVTVDERVAIAAGARAVGTVLLVERGGKVKERARLGVRFHTLVLADGTELPISTEAIYREGESPAGESSRKIGGAAIGGAILGAIMGGKKGAVVGGATGAAGGTAVVMAGDRNAATFPPGTIVTIRLAAPVSVEVEKRE